MSAAQLPPFTPAFTPHQYESLVEPNLIGALLSYGLFGLSMMQFFYCSKVVRPSKQRFITFFLVFLFLLDVADQGTKTAHILLYYRNVVLKGFLGAIKLPAATSLAWQLLTGLITISIQMFYLRRIMLLSRWQRSQAFAAVFIVLCGAMSVTSFVFAVIIGIMPNHLPEVIWWASLYLGGAAGVDVLISGYLLYLFGSMRKEAEFTNTRDLLLQWIHLTIETGGVTALAQLIELGLYIPIQLRSTGYYYAIAFIQPRIYVCSGLVLIRTVLRASDNSGGNSGTGSGSRHGVGSSSGYQGQPYLGRSPNGTSKKLAIRTHSGQQRPHEAIMVTTSTNYRADGVGLRDQHEMAPTPQKLELDDGGLRGSRYGSDLEGYGHAYGARDDRGSFQ